MMGGFVYLGKEYRELPFDVVYAVDNDKWAVETYNKNFEHKATCADIKDVNFTSIPEVDVMIGGFPCQSFSTVNPTKDTNDDRANLYKQIVRFLKIKQPKYFICENVKGIMTLQYGAIIKKIMAEFSQCGYNVSTKMLKAVEFGVPQRRERVIIVGMRTDVSFNYQFPIPICTEATAVPLSRVIDEVAIPDKKYYFSQKAVQGAKNAKPNMKRALWQDLSKPCLTITSHLAKTSMNSRDPILLVDTETELYRRFTPREAARIQSFPESFHLNDSENKSYKQIGNAVPPVFMWHIAKQLEKAINEEGRELKEENYKNKSTQPTHAKKVGVLMVMMQNYGTRSKNFLPNGKLAIRLRETRDSDNIKDNMDSIRYVLFHARNETTKHLFPIVGNCRVQNGDEIGDDRYRNVKDASSYIAVDVDTSMELDATKLHLTNIPFIPATRYDAQYATIEALVQ